MIKEYEYTGKTVEEATENGLKELGLDRDAVSVEILEMPTSKFLGLVKTDAKVKISVEVEDEKVVQPKVCAPVPAAPMEKRAPRAPKSATEKPSQPKREFKENIAPKKAPIVKKDIPARKPEKIIPKDVLDAAAKTGEDFLKETLGILQIDAKITYNTDNNSVAYTLEGEGMGLIIGRRGDTLDALQYLTSLSANKGKEGHIKVSIDTEGYREKREQALVGLATKVSRKVLKTGRSMTLEPMNPYERRIIHSALQDVPNITTKSIGSEPNRKVVVMYEK